MMQRRSLIKDKRGQFSIFGIFEFMIVAFVVILFLAGLVYIQGLLHTTFDAVGVQNEVNAGAVGYTNMSAASDMIWGTLDEAIQSLKLTAGVYILSMAIAIVITNALVKLHPLWFFPYMLVCVLAVIFSATISNAYEAILNQSPAIFGGELTTGFEISNFIMLNLPMVVLVMSVLGGIFLFIGMIRNDAEREVLR